MVKPRRQALCRRGFLMPADEPAKHQPQERRSEDDDQAALRDHSVQISPLTMICSGTPGGVWIDTITVSPGSGRSSGM